jgi:hypothetical protein
LVLVFLVFLSLWYFLFCCSCKCQSVPFNDNGMNCEAIINHLASAIAGSGSAWLGLVWFLSAFVFLLLVFPQCLTKFQVTTPNCGIFLSHQMHIRTATTVKHCVGSFGCVFLVWCWFAFFGVSAAVPLFFLVSHTRAQYFSLVSSCYHYWYRSNFTRHS